MKTLATESLFTRVADYNPTELIKRTHQGTYCGSNFILGKVQFLIFLDAWVLLTKFLGRLSSALY